MCPRAPPWHVRAHQMYYPSTIMSGHQRDTDTVRLQRLVRSADSISLGDLAMRRVRSQQDWKMLPLAAWCNTDAGLVACGAVGPMLPKFPE